MQTEIALSTTEAEYVALSQSLREVIPMMALLEEAMAHGVPLPKSGAKANVRCSAFLQERTLTTNDSTPHCVVHEDNMGALEMARLHKMRPRTKHINIKYHHFREQVDQGRISVMHVDTKDQRADALTKPLAEQPFVYLRHLFMGW